jgi:hypothetical protein
MATTDKKDGGQSEAQKLTDAAENQGFIGTKVDPLPNSAHSLESGPDAPPVHEQARRSTSPTPARSPDARPGPAAADRPLACAAGRCRRGRDRAGLRRPVRRDGHRRHVHARRRDHRRQHQQPDDLAGQQGPGGAGTTSVASLALTSGVNAPAADEKALTLSGTPANLVVASGDVLEFDSTHVGTGIADPGGLVQVTFSRS